MSFNKSLLALAASGSMLVIAMPATAQVEQPDSTMQNPAPTPPEVPADPAPVEAPPAPTPPEVPAPPASPPPATADAMQPGEMTSTGEQMPMNPAPGTMPGAQNTNMTNPPPAPQAVYPRCSRTIVDQCQQSSAREADYKGGPPANRRRRR